MRNLIVGNVFGTEDHIRSLINDLQPKIETNSYGEYSLSITMPLAPNSSGKTTLTLCHSGGLHVNNGLKDWEIQKNFDSKIKGSRPFHMTVRGDIVWSEYLKTLESLLIDWIKSN